MNVRTYKSRSIPLACRRCSSLSLRRISGRPRPRKQAPPTSLPIRLTLTPPNNGSTPKLICAPEKNFASLPLEPSPIPPTKNIPMAAPSVPTASRAGFGDLIHEYAVTDAGHGSLIGRLGDNDVAQPFAVGASSDYEAPVARPALSWNQSKYERRGRRQRKFPGENCGDQSGPEHGGRDGHRRAARNSGAIDHAGDPRANSAPRFRSTRQARRHGQHPASSARKNKWCKFSPKQAGCTWIVPCRTPSSTR